jgi:hypothetical protein
MANTADVIILSSSPIPARSPKLAIQDKKSEPHILQRDTTPTPLPSTTCKPEKHSRFFPATVTSKQGPDNAKNPKKRVNKEDAPSKTDDQAAPKKPQRKVKKSTTEPGSIAPGDLSAESLVSKDAAPKSTRGRPRKTAKAKDSVNKTLAGKVTKASADLPPKRLDKGVKATSVRSPPPEDVTAQSTLKKSDALGKDEFLQLDEATRRRVDWTPPRETACEEIYLSQDGNKKDEGYDGGSTIGFGKLLSDYNYSGLTSNLHELVQNSNAGGPTKRRRIDLVDHQVQSLLNGKTGPGEQASIQDEEVAGKPKRTAKSKPKKFTTLTARMTAQYATKDAEDDEPVLDCTPDPRATKSRRSKAKGMAEESPFTILSPEAAVEFVNDQDLMFGTCSQLEREDSPQTLREMQQAIRASECLSYSDGVRNPATGTAKESSIRSVSRMAGTRNLWCVAARDTEGSLIQSKALNVIDLTDRAESSPQKHSEMLEKPLHKPLPKNWFELEFADIDSPPEKKQLSFTLSEKTSDSSTQSQFRAPAAVLDIATATRPAPAPESSVKATATNTQKKASKAPIEDVNHQPAGLQAPSMPHYAGFTDAELSKQISAFGFKAVRGRKKMLDLLAQCWESKYGSNASSKTEQQIVLVSEKDSGSKTASEPKSKAKPKSGTAASTKKAAEATKLVSSPRTNLQQSPRKSSGITPITGTSAFIDVEEIQDSEEETTPFPSQVQKHYNAIYSQKGDSQVPEHSLDILTKTSLPSPTKRKAVSAKTQVAKASSSTSIKTSRKTKSAELTCLSDVSTQITKAVRVQPRLSPLSSSLGSRVKPTWHEKILMYDPIVLEDFTAWLNIEGLGLVGEDREVGTATVREWCESKGICCCWKKNASW